MQPTRRGRVGSLTISPLAIVPKTPHSVAFIPQKLPFCVITPRTKHHGAVFCESNPTIGGRAPRGISPLFPPIDTPSHVFCSASLPPVCLCATPNIAIPGARPLAYIGQHATARPRSGSAITTVPRDPLATAHTRSGSAVTTVPPFTTRETTVSPNFLCFPLQTTSKPTQSPKSCGEVAFPSGGRGTACGG